MPLSRPGPGNGGRTSEDRGATMPRSSRRHGRARPGRARGTRAWIRDGRGRRHAGEPHAGEPRAGEPCVPEPTPARPAALPVAGTTWSPGPGPARPTSPATGTRSTAWSSCPGPTPVFPSPRPRNGLTVPDTAPPLPPSALAPLLRHAGRPGFVVTDMPDVDLFAPTAVELPDGPLYLVDGVDRGDRMSNWSPDEALPALTSEGRTPLLLTEGMHWVLQTPDVLVRNHCFMTIASRLRKANGSWDARTPAIWISNGTGRDGRARRDAPKVGWCWWNNRHTWLGFASTTGRRPAAA
ncbi:hypothetical protein EF906_08455 [Streptomyces sp. WAC08241]|nr:hypothetical protein EF906_08455 [Streptomyces sp. WAC08241]